MLTRRVRNIKDLTASLVSQYEKFLNGTLSTEEADATARLAGTILGACKVQMEYARMTDSNAPIAFMGPNIRALPAGAPIPQEPGKPTIGELVLKALEGAKEPMSENALCEKLIAQRDLPETYLKDNEHQKGGPYTFIRGALLGLTNAGRLKMGRNEEGRAVFQIAA